MVLALLDALRPREEEGVPQSGVLKPAPVVRPWRHESARSRSPFGPATGTLVGIVADLGVENVDVTSGHLFDRVESRHGKGP